MSESEWEWSTWTVYKLQNVRLGWDN